jgi:hypothetical protein
VSIEGLSPYQRDELRVRFQNAEPFPHLVLDELLVPSLANECAAAYPSYEEAKAMGFEFGALNERLKVQVCEAEKFKPPILALHRALSSPEFLADLEHISGINSLLADPSLAGGGMHVMGGQGGRLDVHVDFNYVEEKAWHRRLNLLVYLNPVWEVAWGGAVELWDTEIKKCYQSVPPLLNKCVIFETSDRSYHGVTHLAAPQGMTRNSFATYYYTREAPAGWDGVKHSTVFRSRPDEKFRGHVLAPAERAGEKLRSVAHSVKKGLKGLVGK